jgi:hypothetical protein
MSQCVDIRELRVAKHWLPPKQSQISCKWPYIWNILYIRWNCINIFHVHPWIDDVTLFATNLHLWLVLSNLKNLIAKCRLQLKSSSIYYNLVTIKSFSSSVTRGNIKTTSHIVSMKHLHACIPTSNNGIIIIQ